MTQTSTYDAIIVGLGAMGSAAAYALARRNARIVGFDRFRPPHNFGSSHGDSRIFREAYFEAPHYVPLAQRAYECWRELERQRGETLLRVCGGLTIGPRGSGLPAGARVSAEAHDLAIEELAAGELRQRFPAFRLTDDMVGVWEARAGVLYPERCIEAHLALAAQHGATLAFDEPVVEWFADGAGVRLRTTKGDYHANRLLLTAGPWLPAFARLDVPFTIERTVMHWFEPLSAAGSFGPDRFPVFLLEHEPGLLFYGFPDLGDGVKVARHHQGRSTHPDQLDRDVAPQEIEAMRSLLRRFLPGANGPWIKSAVCMYTNTPDLHFVIDVHPEHREVILASPCSGHGFKFASVFGEILADLVTERASQFDLQPFRLGRFSSRPSSTGATPHER